MSEVMIINENSPAVSTLSAAEFIDLIMKSHVAVDAIKKENEDFSSTPFKTRRGKKHELMPTGNKVAKLHEFADQQSGAHASAPASPATASTPQAQGSPWLPTESKQGDPFQNFGLICLEYLIYMGMGSCETQMQNNMNYDNDMQPAQSDIIAWFAYLNKIETEAGSAGIADKTVLDNLVKEIKAEMQKFFGHSVWPPSSSANPASAGGWKFSATSGEPGYLDPHSDFGKWMRALWNANTTTDKNGKVVFINGWPGFGGDSSVATVWNMMKDLNSSIKDGNNNSVGNMWQDCMSGDNSAIGGDINQIATNYWKDKQPNNSNSLRATSTPTPIDYLSEYVTDANATNSIFRGIGTQQTTILQQLSSTENGEQSNGDNIIKSIDSLDGYINSHTNSN